MIYILLINYFWPKNGVAGFGRGICNADAHAASKRRRRRRSNCRPAVQPRYNQIGEARRFRRADEASINHRDAAPLTYRRHDPKTLSQARCRRCHAAAAAISYVRRAARIEDRRVGPEVKKTLRGAGRRSGAFQRQAAALAMRALDHIRETTPRKGRGGRLEDRETARRRGFFDIAMIGSMRDAMLRVSEAAVLRRSDLMIERGGTGRLPVRRSKTDAEGHTDILFVSAETIASLENLRKDARPEDLIFDLGPDQTSNRIKRAAIEARLGDGFSSHSPRAGSATWA